MLKVRLASAAFIVPALFLATLCLPSVAVMLLLVAMSMVAILEFYRFLRNAGIPSFKYWGAGCGAALMAGTYADFALRDGGTEWEALAMAVSVMALMVRQFPQKDNDKPLATISCTLCGVFYVPFLLGFFIRLGFAAGPVAPGVKMIGLPAAWLIWYPIFVAKVTDAGALFTGMAIGRHKLIPRLSPSKTWEGLAGGIISGATVSAVYAIIAGDRMGPGQMGVAHAAALGAFLAVVGMTGDLAESLLKRAGSMKDSGTKIPGIGGLLDLIDSVLFVAPAYYIYLRLVLAG